MTDTAGSAHASTLAGTGAASASAAATLESATAALNAWLEVDLGRLDQNLAALRAALDPGVDVIAVVKANAYGAGVAGIAPALERAGVDRFATVWVPEAVALRRLGVRKPILVLGHAFPAEAVAAITHDITLTVHSLDLGRALSEAATARGRVANVHIHIDSGLHRDGVSLGEGVALAEALRQLPGIRVEGLSTHMANADEPDDSFSTTQGDVFAEAAKRLPWVPYRHTANSATALRRQELRYEGVRIGLAMHGIVPPNTPGPGVQPILSLKARVARVVDVAVGEGVSYGLTWRATRQSRVALVPVGYADGWPRHLSNAGEVLIGGRRCPMVGRVCMDQFLADVTDVPGVREGDEIVLLGEQGDERISADQVAEHAGTISWDILASLQARLPRIFHRGGAVELVV
ncbi:MAG: alanine racemase [Dehalococcoidia bacterium]|nr:alanine racemase [Dehalococcoidia bacterium]